MNKYINKYGLLNPQPNDIVSENTLLCTMVYLKKVVTLDPVPNLLTIYRFSTKCKDGSRFNNLPFESSVERDNYTSCDQLNCYMLQDEYFALSIFKTLVTHLGTYDNISKKINFKRTMQPMTLFLAGYCAFNRWLFSVPLLLTMIWSCLFAGKSTSGKQKVWLILKYAFSDFTFNIFNKLFKLDDAVRRYYPEDHPINRE